MARILVSGGFGYVGGRLARALVADGHAVRVQTRRPADRHPAWAGEVEAVRAGLTEPGAAAVLTAGMDAVIHCAAMNEIESARDAAGALAANGLATLRLLEAAEAAGVPRFVYFSTAHVYGAPLAGRCAEDMAVRPRAAYAITHHVAEDFVLAAHAAGRVEGLALRLSNVVGAPADPGVDRWTVVVNDLCRQAVRDDRLVLKSAGSQMRDFVPMADVAAAVRHVLALPRGAWGDGLYNLGAGRGLSIRAIAGLVAERAEVVLGRRPPLIAPDPAPGEVAADLDFRIDRLRALGWTPGNDLPAAIDETLRLCRGAAP